jgi:hypothetical protein
VRHHRQLKRKPASSPENFPRSFNSQYPSLNDLARFYQRGILVLPILCLSIMLSSIAVTTQSSWLLPLRSPVKSEWPDPELSIGRECRSLGRNKCWEVAGPAQAIEDCILPKVKCLLESRNEYLNEKEPVPVPVILGYYMIGRSEKKSNPTLLFMCQKKVPRRKALNIVMESGLLSSYPGVLLAESPRSPLASGPAVSLGLDHLEPAILGRAFDIYLAPSISPSGMLIHIQDDQGGSAASRSATIGGLVYSENEELERKYYGVTVAHVFAQHVGDNLESPENDDNEEDDIDFAFYRQGDDEEDEDEDEDFVEATSRGKSTENGSAIITNSSAGSVSPSSVSEASLHTDFSQPNNAVNFRQGTLQSMNMRRMHANVGNLWRG